MSRSRPARWSRSASRATSDLLLGVRIAPRCAPRGCPRSGPFRGTSAASRVCAAGCRRLSHRRRSSGLPRISRRAPTVQPAGTKPALRAALSRTEGVHSSGGPRRVAPTTCVRQVGSRKAPLAGGASKHPTRKAEESTRLAQRDVLGLVRFHPTQSCRFTPRAVDLSVAKPHLGGRALRLTRPSGPAWGAWEVNPPGRSGCSYKVRNLPTKLISRKCPRHANRGARLVRSP